MPKLMKNEEMPYKTSAASDLEMSFADLLPNYLMLSRNLVALVIRKWTFGYDISEKGPDSRIIDKGL